MAAPATPRIGRRTVAVTSPDKVLFPRAKVTKLDLAQHYERVAALMLPDLADRPLALQAFPEGIDGPGLKADRGAKTYVEVNRNAYARTLP